MAETTNGTSNSTSTVTYECPYRNICSDNGRKCETCRHNPKRSYYEPVEPYIPYIPYSYPYSYPYPYWYPTTICYGTTTSTATDEFHYQSI